MHVFLLKKSYACEFSPGTDVKERIFVQEEMETFFVFCFFV